MGAVLVSVGTAGLSSLPLLKVTTALTSLILAFGSLAEPISCIPLEFRCVWEGNFPFSSDSCHSRLSKNQQNLFTPKFLLLP